MFRLAALAALAGCAPQEPTSLPLVINPDVDAGFLLAQTPGELVISFTAGRDTTVVDAEADDPAWEVLSPAGEATPLARGDVLDVVIAVPASEVGVYSAGLQVVAADGALLGETTVTYTAEVAEGSVSPAVVDVGTVPVGTSTTASFQATNDSLFAWEITPNPTDARLTAPDAPFRIEPGTTGQVTIDVFGEPPLGSATFRVPCVVGPYELALVEVTAEFVDAG